MQVSKELLIEYLGFLGVKAESIISIDPGKWCFYVAIRKDPYLFDPDKGIDRFPYILKVLDRTFSVSPRIAKKGRYEFRIFSFSRHPVMEYEAAKRIFSSLKQAGFLIDPLSIDDDGYVLSIKAKIDESLSVEPEYRVNRLKEQEDEVRNRGWGYRESEISPNRHEFIIAYRCHRDLGFPKGRI